MTATEKLERLRQEVVEAKQNSRELRAEAGAANGRAARARDALVEAHAQGKRVKQAENAHTKALEAAEQAAIRAEGAELRAGRAEQAVAGFMAGEHQALLDDLTPEAQAARDGLADAFEAVFAAAQRWNDVAAQATLLVNASGRGNSRTDGPSENPFATAIHALRQAVSNGPDVPLPLPHWQHLKFLEQQQREAVARQQRERADRAKAPA